MNLWASGAELSLGRWRGLILRRSRSWSWLLGGWRLRGLAVDAGSGIARRVDAGGDGLGFHAEAGQVRHEGRDFEGHFFAFGYVADGLALEQFEPIAPGVELDAAADGQRGNGADFLVGRGRSGFTSARSTRLPKCGLMRLGISFCRASTAATKSLALASWLL